MKTIEELFAFETNPLPYQIRREMGLSKGEFQRVNDELKEISRHIRFNMR